MTENGDDGALNTITEAEENEEDLSQMSEGNSQSQVILRHNIIQPFSEY